LLLLLLFEENLFNPNSLVLPNGIFPLLPPAVPPLELPLNQFEEESSASDAKHAYKVDFIAGPI